MCPFDTVLNTQNIFHIVGALEMNRKLDLEIVRIYRFNPILAIVDAIDCDGRIFNLAVGVNHPIPAKIVFWQHNTT